MLELLLVQAAGGVGVVRPDRLIETGQEFAPGVADAADVFGSRWNFKLRCASQVRSKTVASKQGELARQAR